MKAQIESLRINGKTNNKIEFGLSISYDAGYGTYSIPGGGVWQGVPEDNNVGLSVTAHTMFTVHTHYSGLNSAPSCGDIIATVSFYKFVKESKGTYRGTIIFAANGSEYMIYVDDPTALEKFYTGLVGNDFYERDGSDFKKGSQWREDYLDIKDNLEDKGFSQNEAQSYALSYLTDKYKMGLNISSRSSKINDFKEQKTTTAGTGKKSIYKPQICP